jgi:hypothetical protein
MRPKKRTTSTCLAWHEPRQTVSRPEESEKRPGPGPYPAQTSLSLSRLPILAATAAGRDKSLV